MMNVLGLFAGIGGIELGLERAGMRIVGLVERDKWCRGVLAAHWPDAAIHDDVDTTPSWWNGRARVDVVTGGFPCQPFSISGKQKGTEDDRWEVAGNGRCHSLSTTPLRRGGERRSSRSRWTSLGTSPRRPSHPRVRCGVVDFIREPVRRTAYSREGLPRGLRHEQRWPGSEHIRNALAART